MSVKLGASLAKEALHSCAGEHNIKHAEPCNMLFGSKTWRICLPAGTVHSLWVHADFTGGMKVEEEQGFATVRPSEQAEPLAGADYSAACNGTLAVPAAMIKAEPTPAQRCVEQEPGMPMGAIRAAAALAATARAQAAAGTCQPADPGPSLIRRSGREVKSRIIMVRALDRDIWCLCTAQVH